MRVIIAGSRTITKLKHVRHAISMAGFRITEVVSGGAVGVDTLGEDWAEATGTPCRIFHADWKRYGKRAGPMRNTAMVAYAEALIAVWDGKSRGTKDTIDKARAQDMRVYVHVVM